MKSLYTNVSIRHGIDIALKKLYSQIEPFNMSRSKMKRPLFMAVSNVHFKCNDTCYVLKDGLAMSAHLAAILANLWLKDYEKCLAMDSTQNIDILNDMNGKCPKCSRRVTFRTKVVQYEGCLNWYQKDCGGFSDEDYKGISEEIWFCKLCNERCECELIKTGEKLFCLYVDIFVRNNKVDSNIVLQAANKLHPNLQITLETPNENADLIFLDIYINVDGKKQINCGWY